MHFTCRSFIGSTDPVNWCQYWENEPDDLILAASRGHLFGLISLTSNPEGQDLKTLGHDIIYEINQTYFATDSTENIITSLQKTINSITENPLFSHLQKIIIIAIVVDKHLYLISSGNSKVIFQRQAKISTILESEEGIVNTVSGQILPEDKILLITNDFYQQITWEKIKTFIADEKVQNIEENIMSELFSVDNQQGLAAAFIQVHSDEPAEILVEEDNRVIPETNIIKPSFSFSFIHKINFNFLKKFKKPITISTQEVYQVRKRKKLNLFIIIILIVGLSISSYLGFQKNKVNQTESQYQNFKNEVDQKINNAIAVKNLNLDSALGLAKESQTIIQKMTALKIHSDEVSQYQTQVNLLLSQTGGEESFVPPSFYDTSLINNNPSYSKILLSQNQLYLLDTHGGRIDSIDIAQKSNKNVSISEKLKSSFDMVENNGIVYAVNNSGLFLISKTDLESKLTFPDINPAGYSFWNGAFYILDSNTPTIWKFAPNSTGFSAPQKWLKEGETINSNSVSLAINGKIWVLSADGKITPFVTGKKDVFKPTQVATVTKASNLVTTLDDDIIAFVDSDNLIYIYKKTGELLAKYNLNKLKISDIVIEDKSSNLYILCTDQKIYKISF